MLTDSLLRHVLREPSARADHLIVVSGFVSGSMALRHVFGNAESHISGLDEDTVVDVVYGMYPSEGVLRSDHQTFLTVHEQKLNYRVSYYLGSTPLHSKLYVWLKKETPIIAFLGSANYSIRGFYGHTQEAMSEVNPARALHYVNSILRESTPAHEIQNPRFRSRYLSLGLEEADTGMDFDQAVRNLQRETLPLWARSQGRMHSRSGLNWGQRDGREPNQAYVPVPSEVAKKGFFPARGDFFQVLTDDEKVFDCVVAQDGDKAVETPLDNSVLGKYFRRRLGVPLGAPVTLADLDRYGRRDVDFYRAGEDRYLLDFRPRPIK